MSIGQAPDKARPLAKKKIHSQRDSLESDSSLDRPLDADPPWLRHNQNPPTRCATILSATVPVDDTLRCVLKV